MVSQKYQKEEEATSGEKCKYLGLGSPSQSCITFSPTG